MKHRIWLIVLLIAAAGAFMTGCDKMWPDESAPIGISKLVCGEPKVVTIWAGQHIDAGTVTVTNCTESLCVKIQTRDGWMLYESHFAIANSCAELPRNKKGHLVPGRFPYSATHNPPVSEYGCCIPLGDWEPGDTVSLAVHVVVKKGGQEETGWADTWKGCFRYVVQECYKDVNLPADSVRMRGWHPYADKNSYWKIELANVPAGYDVFNGMWVGWCAERTVTMSPNTWYTVKLWSSQDPALPARLLKNGEWDRVNYLLNNKLEGATWSEIQNAIWYLLGLLTPKPGGRASQMVDDAEANGDGFRPMTGQWIAVLLADGPNTQLTFIEVDP